MKKRKLATLATQANLQEDNTIKGIANSLTKTRSGITVTQAAGNKVTGQVVPLLANHKWDTMPVGSVTMGVVDDEGLHYEGKLFESIDHRDQILESIKAGVLSVSIGFGVDDMDEEGNINSIDLLEMSLTPVPADSKATITQSLVIEDDSSNDTPPTPPAPDTGKDDNPDPAKDPVFKVGDVVTINADHMPNMKGAIGQVVAVYGNAYEVNYWPTDGGDEVKNHKWLVGSEMELSTEDYPTENPNEKTDEGSDDNSSDEMVESLEKFIDKLDLTFVQKLDYETMKRKLQK